MTRIYLETHITAAIESVFDLSRNIDFHMQSASQTNEKAIAGCTSGLINLGETVTWKGKHFGMYLTHQSKITELEFPSKFTDEMLKGHFKSFKHQHLFYNTPSGTRMVDILDYEVPYGIWGKLFDRMLLKKHLTKFLMQRNLALQTVLEQNFEGQK